MNELEHPSYFALDQLAVGSAVDEQVRRHVQGCARCRSHVERMHEPCEVPAWASQLQAQQAPRLRSRLTWAGGAVGVLAAAAALMLMRAPEPEPERSEPAVAPYTTTRGAPAVALYVKRGPRVLLWDGQSEVRAGDRLRLKVVPEGYRYVGVFAPVDGELRPLFRAALQSPDAEELLPSAWQVDDAPGSETLVVVLSHEPVRPSDAQGAGRADTWLRTLRIPKTSDAQPEHRDEDER